jgi:hypothetical protein
VKTCTTTDNSNNLSIICHSGCEIDHSNKYQNGKEGYHQINDPERIKNENTQDPALDQELCIFYPWNLLLNINYKYHYRQQYQHETESSKVFFNDISV